jgi:hypothetical protein
VAVAMAAGGAETPPSACSYTHQSAWKRRSAKRFAPKLSEKSLRCPRRGLEGAQIGPFKPRYTGQIHAWSVTRTPFQTVSQRRSTKLAYRAEFWGVG